MKVHWSGGFFCSSLLFEVITSLCKLCLRCESAVTLVSSQAIVLCLCLNKPSTWLSKMCERCGVPILCPWDLCADNSIHGSGSIDCGCSLTDTSLGCHSLLDANPYLVRLSYVLAHTTTYSLVNSMISMLMMGFGEHPGYTYYICYTNWANLSTSSKQTDRMCSLLNVHA